MDSERERQINVSFTLRLIGTGCMLIFLAVYSAYTGLAEWIWILLLLFGGISVVSAFYLDKRL